jgi:CheY-like chemotaxis protein
MSELDGARADFLASLSRRMESVRQALQAVAEEPNSRSRRDALVRRVHALAAAARVLGFQALGDTLESAERSLTFALNSGSVEPSVLEKFRRTIAGAQALAWQDTSGPGVSRITSSRTPAPGCVLFVGGREPSQALRQELPSFEIESCEPAQAAARALALAPDVLVGDPADAATLEAIRALADQELLAGLPVVFLGAAPPDLEGRPGLEVRSLARPVSLASLREVVEAVAQKPGRAPTGDADASGARPLGALTLEELSLQLASELQRGLVDAADSASRGASVDLGEGAEARAAIWGAIARIREFVSARSNGEVRFSAAAPHGARVFAPGAGAPGALGRRNRSLPPGEMIPLAGRRVVVADDDPAVVWFLAGALRNVGVDVLPAHDGAKALELVWLAWPDFVISDILMPELDGFALCREIKRDVAVRDTPVLLLSWKEDLLQRLRELGADADGYLRKEDPAAEFVERAREVLRPRARIEARLEEGVEARGRLEGLTPRTVLELACRNAMNARVRLRDAVHVYELEVRGGTLLAATRTALDGRAETGGAVLGPLLGVGAGRFAIEPTEASCREDFEGPLQEVLGPAIRAARAAQRALSADRLLGVARVGIDPDALDAYMVATPAPLASLVRGIAAGAAPRVLLVEGRVAPTVLENLLTDLARRGAIRSVEGFDGADLLEEARATLGGTAGPVTASLPPDAPAGFSFDLARDEAPGAASGASGSAEPPTPEANPHGGPAAPAVRPVAFPNGKKGGTSSNPALPSRAATLPSEPSPLGTDPPPGRGSRAPDVSVVEDRRRAFPTLQTGHTLEGESEREAGSSPAAAGAGPAPDGAALPAERALSFPSAKRPEGELGNQPAPQEDARDEADAEASSEDEAPADAPEDTFPESAEEPASNAEARGRRESPPWLATLRVAGLTMLAAVGSYAVVSTLVGLAREPKQPAAAASASASTPRVVSSAPAATPPKIDELPLPIGVEAGAGQGLLEVVTPDRDPIYVKGAFMGTGPVRPVLLAAGTYELRVGSDGSARTLQVTLVPGKRTRVELTKP